MHNYSIILFIFAVLLHKYTSMSTKKERLDAICRIIQTEKIGNQEELLKQLENSGFQVTQATLSRDIKQLKVIKVHDGDGNYVYRLPDYSAEPGSASSVAAALDSALPEGVLGSIAGDDTILIIPREGISRDKIVKALAHFI